MRSLLTLALLAAIGTMSPSDGWDAKAAGALLASLTPAQRSKAVHPFDAPLRKDWHFVPRARVGVHWGELSESQRKDAKALLAESLSASGLARAEAIRTLEAVLEELEGPHRDPDAYYFTFFGEPSSEKPWAWRYEGHHLSLNFTCAGGKLVAGSPRFFGANPAAVASGPYKGLRPLAKEEDLARNLVASLPPERRSKAAVSDRAPADILTGNRPRVSPLEPVGIRYAELSKEEQSRLKEIVALYADSMPAADRETRLARIEKSRWDEVRFAWMGGLEPGQGHYYRIQGASFLIEYDNTQNRANHVHSVWREFDGDFGEDALAEHYRTAAHHRHER